LPAVARESGHETFVRHGTGHGIGAYLAGISGASNRGRCPVGLRGHSFGGDGLQVDSITRESKPVELLMLDGI